MYAGADPSRRDYGRGLCAEEWARFCGCHNSADAIAKYIRSTKYFLKKTFRHLSKVRSYMSLSLLTCLSSCMSVSTITLKVVYKLLVKFLKRIDFWTKNNELNFAGET